MFWRGGRRDVLNSNGDWTPLLCNTRMRGRVSTACGEMRRGDHAGGGLRGWVGPCFYPMDGAVGGPRDGWWNQQHHHQHFVSRGDFYLTVAMDRDSLGDGIHLGLRLSHCCSADFCGGNDRDSELKRTATMRCTSGIASTSWSTQTGMTLSTVGVTGDSRPDSTHSDRPLALIMPAVRPSGHARALLW